VVLAVFLPLVFVAGLRARHHQVPEHIDPSSDSASSDFKPMENVGLRVRANDGYIEVVPARPLNSPDPLLYFGQGPQIEGAILLGALEGSQMRRFAVPGSGYLILYSLARREIVGFERLNVSWSSR